MKPQPRAIVSASSRMTVASSNDPPAETQQQPRYKLIHHNAAIGATENITQDKDLNTVRNIGENKNRKKRAIGCESLRIDVDESWVTI